MLDALDGVGPEGRGHHLGHVAAEGIDALGCPKEEDVRHFVPRVRHGVKVLTPSVQVVHAIVQLHRFIPVVHLRPGIKAVVARSLGWRFFIGRAEVFSLGKMRMQRFAGHVVEVVLRRKGLRLVVVGAKVAHTGGGCIAVVLTRYVVGHKVHHHFQSGFVRAVHQCLKLPHAL